MIRVVGGAACHRAPISGRRGEGLLSDSGGRQARARGGGGVATRAIKFFATTQTFLIQTKFRLRSVFPKKRVWNYSTVKLSPKMRV